MLRAAKRRKQGTSKRLAGGWKRDFQTRTGPPHCGLRTEAALAKTSVGSQVRPFELNESQTAFRVRYKAEYSRVLGKSQEFCGNVTFWHHDKVMPGTTVTLYVVHPCVFPSGQESRRKESEPRATWQLFPLPFASGHSASRYRASSLPGRCGAQTSAWLAAGSVPHSSQIEPAPKPTLPACYSRGSWGFSPQPVTAWQAFSEPGSPSSAHRAK